MAKLKLPPGNKPTTKSLKLNGQEIRFTAPENHTGKSTTIQQLQKAIKEGAFKGMSLGEDGRLA